MTQQSKEFYLLLLEYALVEIRALQTNGELEDAPKWADVFHNVPGAVRLPWTVEREQRIRAQLHEKARLYGLSERLARWESRAIESLNASGKSNGLS